MASAVAQGNWNEGSDSGQRETTRSEDLQENVLLHHAGGHTAASPDSCRGHDGELSPSQRSVQTKSSFMIVWNAGCSDVSLALIKHCTSAAGVSQPEAGRQHGCEDGTGEQKRSTLSDVCAISEFFFVASPP